MSSVPRGQRRSATQYQFPTSPTKITARSRHLPPPDAITIRSGTRSFTELLPPFNKTAPLIQHIAARISRSSSFDARDPKSPSDISHAMSLTIPQRINVRTSLKFSTIRQIRLERPQFLTALTWQKMRPQFGRGHLGPVELVSPTTTRA